MVKPPAEPEFSRAVPLSEIGSGAKVRHLLATETERLTLARRFGLLALDRLEADALLLPDGQGYEAKGTFVADVTQACVASGTPVPAHIEEAFHVRFVAEAGFQEEAEVELDADECDTLFHDGRAIDLGEAVAQSLALALDPFPRSADADSILRAAGVKDEAEAGPFGALAALKDKLGKG